MKVVIFVEEHHSPLSIRLQKWLDNNNNVIIKNIEYAIRKGMFSVLILYIEKK